MHFRNKKKAMEFKQYLESTKGHKCTVHKTKNMHKVVIRKKGNKKAVSKSIMLRRRK